MAFGGILEELLLRESATPEQASKAIDNHSYVIINYHTDGDDDNTGSRVIMPVAFGATTASNPVIRAYQPWGDSTTSADRWKYFRLDRISYWEETQKKFYRGDLPDESKGIGKWNETGDKTMSVVYKTIKFGNNTDATNGVNLGPKTKEKVRAVSNAAVTDGDKVVQLGARNINWQKANIHVDTDNNKKVQNGFNMYTDETPIAYGPREPDSSYKPLNVSGSPEKGDIDKNELEKLRLKVQNADRTDILNNDELWNVSEPEYNDYSHDWDDDEITHADWDKAVMNREPWQNKDLSTSKRKWDRYQNGINAADRMFKNRNDSGNRVLYNMDQDKKEKENDE